MVNYSLLWFLILKYRVAFVNHSNLDNYPLLTISIRIKDIPKREFYRLPILLSFKKFQ